MWKMHLAIWHICRLQLALFVLNIRQDETYGIICQHTYTNVKDFFYLSFLRDSEKVAWLLLPAVLTT